MSVVKKIIKKIIYREKATSKSYIEYLRKKGVKIGNDVIFYSPINSYVDIQYPWMISIGNNVRITHGVILITHDFAWSVLKKLPSDVCDDLEGAVFGASGHIVIGNNVFIGMNSIITRNVTIGDNVIIGAGSIVTKDCASNTVYAGNPAKKIMGIEDYYKKRKNCQEEEATQLALAYKKRYGKNPPKQIFSEYFMLFEDHESVRDNDRFVEQILLCENPNSTFNYMRVHKPKFENYDKFMKTCFDDFK